LFTVKPEGPHQLGVDARAVQDDTLYRCHDLILAR
jgi:hypothetical protein